MSATCLRHYVAQMINGRCDERFAALAEEFERNFAERGEVGASVCLMVDGEAVVDLWGGVADQATGRAWTSDTVAVIWSSTKGATALCAHILAGRGQLDLDAPVTRYWPEYGKAGKENTTVAMVLSHQAGMLHPRTPVPIGGFYDWDWMIDTIAAEEPHFEPGTRHGYQPMTYGWMVGEIVRRVTGQSLGEFFATEVAGPLGLEFWIGAPPEVHARVAPLLFPEVREDGFIGRAMADPESPTALLFGNSGGHMEPGPDNFDSPSAYSAELGGGGGLANARALAGMYAPLSLGGGALVPATQIHRMNRPVSAGMDVTLRVPTRIALGYMTSTDNRALAGAPAPSMIIGPQAFGHPGFGGSIGFADPQRRFSFGYVMNKMGDGVLLDDRAQSMVDVVYRTLGATTDQPGVWI